MSRNHRKRNKGVQTASKKNVDTSDKTEKPKSNITEIATLITAIATIITSCATLWTVKEMREERDQAYKPEIVFESSQCIHSYYNIAESTFLESGYNILYFLSSDDYKDQLIPPLETTINNIGSGPASDVTVSFQLDNYEEYISQIAQIYSDANIETFSDGFQYSVSYDFKDYRIEDDLQINKPYLLRGESFSINIPKEYCKLLYLLAGGVIDDELDYQPLIPVKIEYTDLQGKKYVYSYELLVSIDSHNFLTNDTESKPEDDIENDTDQEETMDEIDEEYLIDISYKIEEVSSKIISCE